MKTILLPNIVLVVLAPALLFAAPAGQMPPSWSPRDGLDRLALQIRIVKGTPEEAKARDNYTFFRDLSGLWKEPYAPTPDEYGVTFGVCQGPLSREDAIARGLGGWDSVLDGPLYQYDNNKMFAPLLDEKPQTGTHLYAFAKSGAKAANVALLEQGYVVALSPDEFKEMNNALTEGEIFDRMYVRLLWNIYSDLQPEISGWNLMCQWFRDNLFVAVLAVLLLLAAVAAAVYFLLERRRAQTAAQTDSAVTGDTVVTDVVPAEPGVELCPYHNEPLINGECPHGCTITRCAECGAILKDGQCPNGCKAPEYCPSCGTRILEDGSCPNGCTIIRCSNCGAILRDGECPNGCNADPLHFGWGGSVRPDMTDFSLEVVTPEEFAGFSIDIPSDFIVGRSARDAHEPFLEMLVLDSAKKQECSRRYVQFALAADGSGFDVSMLKNHNFAFVNGRRISREGETERLVEDSTIRLNPGFELRLVRRTGEDGGEARDFGDAGTGPAPTGVSDNTEAGFDNTDTEVLG